MALTVQAFNPIRVTGTTDVSQAIIADAVYKTVKLRFIYWFNPTTAGDLCTLKDANGNFIAELRCETNAKSVYHYVDAHYDNIYCDDMDSGTLYLYIK